MAIMSNYLRRQSGGTLAIRSATYRKDVDLRLILFPEYVSEGPDRARSESCQTIRCQIDSTPPRGTKATVRVAIIHGECSIAWSRISTSSDEGNRFGSPSASCTGDRYAPRAVRADYSNER